MPLHHTPLSDGEKKENAPERLRLARPGRFFARLGLLVLLAAAIILTAGYLREAGQTNASGDRPATPAPTPAATPLPTPTPGPTPTPTPTPPPAPDGYAWHNLLVVLDPGHGGRDPGTCTSDESLQEKDVTLDVARRCAELLEAGGIPVLLTRTGDVALADTVNQDLAARSRMANEADATLYISIHVNSLDLSQRGAAGVFGLECYYREKDPVYDALGDQWLATRIGEAVSTATGNRLLGVFPRSLAVVRETDMPAVLLEIGYLTNQEDEARLRSDAYRQQVAEGIAQGAAEAVALLDPQTYKGTRRVLKRLPLPTPSPAAAVENGMSAPDAGTANLAGEGPADPVEADGSGATEVGDD